MIFTFGFDDGYKSWIKASQILNENGYRGVFNASLRNIVLKRKNTRQRMFPDSDVLTWDELKTIQSLNHEIASHGVRHVDLPLCNRRELELEINDSFEVFKSHEVNVSTYTCAFNRRTKEAEELSRKNYSSFRLRTGVNSVPVTGRTYRGLSDELAITYAVKNKHKNEWVYGAWHDVNVNKFLTQVKEIKKHGITVKTVKDMIP